MKFLAVLLLVLLSLPLIPVPAQPKDSSNAEITHVLNRLTFGARPGDIEKVRSLGIQSFIDAQLNPNTIAESPTVLATVQNNPFLTAPSSHLLAEFAQFRKQQKAAKLAKANIANGEGEATPAVQRPENLRQAAETAVIETKFVRAIESPRQLNELMADFWFNHFNVCITKGVDRILVGAYEEQAIRPYVLGDFRDLLGATMHHPAMMFYLDNADNTKAGFAAQNPKNKKRGINENYARELLELHTLGVDGGYTQKDVMELARVLTGWGLPNIRKQNMSRDNGYWASFDARRHDFGEKIVLGQRISGTGAQEIEVVLDRLAKHPSTAHHISYQLAQYFVDDKPPASLVDKLAARYSQTGGNIKQVLTTLFSSPEFWDTKYQNNKFKSPFHYTVSAFRATGLHVDRPKQLAQFLKLQGEPLYACLTPDGYKNTKETWLNPDGLLKRMDFALKLANYQRRISSTDYRSIMDAVNGGNLSSKTQQAIAKAPEEQRVAALISSPEFMNY